MTVENLLYKVVNNDAQLEKTAEGYTLVCTNENLPSAEAATLVECVNTLVGDIRRGIEEQNRILAALHDVVQRSSETELALGNISKGDVSALKALFGEKTRGRKPKASGEAPKKRGRKPKEGIEEAAPKKRGRKPKEVTGEPTTPSRVPQKVKIKKVKTRRSPEAAD